MLITNAIQVHIHNLQIFDNVHISPLVHKSMLVTRDQKIFHKLCSKFSTCNSQIADILQLKTFIPNSKLITLNFKFSKQV